MTITYLEFNILHYFVFKEYTNILRTQGLRIPKNKTELYGVVSNISQQPANSLHSILNNSPKVKKYIKETFNVASTYNSKAFYDLNNSFEKKRIISFEINSNNLGPLLAFIDCASWSIFKEKMNSITSVKNFKVYYYSLSREAVRVFDVGFYFFNVETKENEFYVNLKGFHERLPDEELIGTAEKIDHPTGKAWTVKLKNDLGLNVTIYFLSEHSNNSSLINESVKIDANMSGVNSFGELFKLECTLISENADNSLHNNAALYHSVLRSHSKTINAKSIGKESFQINETNILQLKVLSNKNFALLNIDTEGTYVFSHLNIDNRLGGHLISPKYGLDSKLNLNLSIINSKNQFLQFNIFDDNAKILHKAFLPTRSLLYITKKIVTGTFLSMVRNNESSHPYVMIEANSNIEPQYFSKNEIEEESKRNEIVKKLYDELTKKLYGIFNVINRNT